MTKKQIISALIWGSVLTVLFSVAFGMLNLRCFDDPSRSNVDAESQMCVP